MRRDKLDRAIKLVHWTVPKYFWKRCCRCDDDVKEETMWWHKEYGFNYTYKVWTCRRCAPLMSDFFTLHKHRDQFKGLDISPIIKEEEELQRANEESNYDKDDM